ncbi:MAG: histidine kinase N-terminal 7TM domain-containing protein [Acutalibacteraceae bacterium]
MLGLIRGMIYISIMAAWGVTVHLRIVQKQVRQYLGAISFLIILWLTIRTVKFEFVENPTAIRYLWYSYYFSMLFIPLFALFVSLSLGKSEDYRIPKWTRVFYIPAFLIFLMVFTNDLHQCVFVFTGGGEWSDSSYEYSFGIYIAVAWQVLCAASAIVIMIIKCRIPQSKKFFGLPLVLLAAATVYTALYAIKVPWIMYVAGDFTVSLCLFTVGIFECCIQCRMIQSNTGYDRLFSITTIGAHITDEKLKIKNSSKTAVELTGEIMAQAVNGSVMLDENTVLKSHKIHKGYVFWQEDVSELADITKKLEQTQEELRDTGDVLKAESEQKAHWLQIVEENRLYDMIENQTAPQIARLKDILEKLKKTTGLPKLRDFWQRLLLSERILNAGAI